MFLFRLLKQESVGLVARILGGHKGGDRSPGRDIHARNTRHSYRRPE